MDFQSCGVISVTTLDPVGLENTTFLGGTWLFVLELIWRVSTPLRVDSF